MFVNGLRVALVAVLLAGCAGPEALGPAGAPATEPMPEAPAVEDPERARSEQDPATAPRAAGLAAIEEIVVKMEDGVVLRGHVYLPDTPPPYAVVLGFGPYWGSEFPATADMGNGAGGLRWIYDDETYAALLASGFAVAFANIRGTGSSGGCYHFFSPDDAADAAAMIGSLAAAPWSNGAVGMYGVSYDAWTQYAAMSAGPPALRATVPVSGILDPWSVSTRNGAVVRNYLGAGTLYTAQMGLDLASVASGTGDPGLPSPAPEHACVEGALDTWSEDAVALDGDRSEAYLVRDLRPGVAASGIPAFATYGLAQPSMGDDGRVTPFEGLVMNAQRLSDVLPAGSRIVLGPWPHGPPTYPNFTADVVAWFDAHLRNRDPPSWPAVRYQTADGAWRSAQTWPPPHQASRMGLPAGRSLVSTDRLPSLAICGPDQAAYEWPPVAESLALSGSFVLEIELTSTAPDGGFAAWLFSTSEDVCDGEGVPIARAHTDLRHRGDLDVGRPFPIGAPATIRVESAPFAADVPAGSHLALVIAGGDPLLLLPEASKPLLMLGEGSLELPVVEYCGIEGTSPGAP